MVNVVTLVCFRALANLNFCLSTTAELFACGPHSGQLMRLYMLVLVLNADICLLSWERGI